MARVEVKTIIMDVNVANSTKLIRGTNLLW
jgi:hypothetical protein